MSPKVPFINTITLHFRKKKCFLSLWLIHWNVNICLLPSSYKTRNKKIHKKKKTLLSLILYIFLLLFQLSTFAAQAEKAAGLRQWDGGPPQGKQQLPSSCFLPLDRPTVKSTKRKFLYTVFSWLFVKGRSGTLSTGLKIKSGIHFFGNFEAAGTFLTLIGFKGLLLLFWKK